MTAADWGEEVLRDAASAMSATLRHRGPDDAGSWADPTAGVAFGFRRLAIIDVSSSGHQPMQSRSGRFTMVFNGEVYNYLEIRKELERENVQFRGNSDSEVILEAFERWGIDRAVPMFIGMFAISVWDSRERRLSLVRDRLGIKPLFYSHRPGLLTFGSELKALAAGPGFDATIDNQALDAFLRYLYVPAPRSIFRHVRKLLPGHILHVRGVHADLPGSSPYWSLEEVYVAAQDDPFPGDDADAVAELRALLSDAVRLRMRSDVPMGALLSGGIDSSTVVALMQTQSSIPTRTFSIGFPGTVHDEARHAAGVAHVLGTKHTELAVTGDEALDVVPSLPELFDEPLADPSQIPTYLVSKLARNNVTVALTGDGGDELLGGYERYIQGARIIAAARRIPVPLRRMAAIGIRAPRAAFWQSAYRRAAPLLDPQGRHRLAGEKVRKLGALLSHRRDGDMYHSLISAGWQNPASALVHMASGPSRLEELIGIGKERPLLDRMMLLDQQTYLADDLLAKVDRASMAVSLEARVPLLDHRLVEFSWRLRPSHKIRRSQGKWALRQVLYGFLPPKEVDRPKTGFSVPIAAWLRGPLRSWAEDLMLASNAGRDEWLAPTVLRRRWDELKRGDDDGALALWATLMFEAWRRRWAT